MKVAMELCHSSVWTQSSNNPRSVYMQEGERDETLWTGIRLNTCRGGVLRLEQSHYALPVEAAGAQQHGFGARVFPAQDRQPVMSVAACDFLQTAVLHRLRHHQQPGVTAHNTEV